MENSTRVGIYWTDAEVDGKLRRTYLYQKQSERGTVVVQVGTGHEMIVPESSAVTSQALPNTEGSHPRLEGI